MSQRFRRISKYYFSRILNKSDILISTINIVYAVSNGISGCLGGGGALLGGPPMSQVYFKKW